MHLSALKWGRDAARALGARAAERYDRRLAAGQLYARASDLLDEEDLPSLPVGIRWTRTLLANLLPKAGRFVLVGNQKDAYVPASNRHGIKTLADLVGTILRRDHDGACPVDAFEQELRYGGVIKRRLTPAMLGDSRQVCIRGRLVLLTELADSA